MTRRFCYALLSGNYAHHLRAAARPVEADLVLRLVLHDAGSSGVERVVAPHADVYARKVLTTPLADDNLARANWLVVVFLNAQPLRG